MARIAPITPPKVYPAKSTMIVTSGAVPVADSMTLGTIRLFSNCWIRILRASAPNPTKGETVNPIRIAGIAAIVGPRLGTASSKPARVASGKA